MASPEGTGSSSFVVQYAIQADKAGEFSRLVGDLGTSAAKARGFLGTEVHLDPSGTAPTVVWRFTTLEAARTWQSSSAMASFEQSLEPFSTAKPVHNVLVNPAPSSTASTIITTRVKPGSDTWYADWQGRMGAAQQKFPGYLGQRVQAPLPGTNNDWVAIVAFDSPEDLKRWEDSPERAALVKESEPYVERYYVRPADSAFESWFAKTDGGGKPPPGWKLSAIVLLVLYPIVMLEFFTLNHLTVDVLHLNPALGVFIGNAISVAITGFLLIPWASGLLNWWLVPPEAEAARRTRQGALVVVGLYAISVIVFWVVVARFPQLMP